MSGRSPVRGLRQGTAAGRYGHGPCHRRPLPSRSLAITGPNDRGPVPTGSDVVSYRTLTPSRSCGPAPGPAGSVGGMRILVTGGAGFIGSAVVRALATAGHHVRVLDALLPAVHPGGRAPELPPGVEFLHRDVRDAAAVEQALAGVDAVCHQAAMVGLGLDLADAPEYVGCNDLGTAVLLAAMARTGVRRLVLAGSMVVYGEGRYRCTDHGDVALGPRRPAELDAGRFEPPCPTCGAPLQPGLVTEDAPGDPRNVYAATKLAQEHLAAAWARAGEVPS